MNGYICFWNGKQCEVYADTSYNAQQQSIPLFQRIAGRKRVKGSDITVVLAEKDGTIVTHSGGELS